MLIVFMVQFTQMAFAYGVSISWNKNPEGDVAGYKVYYGTSSHNYSTMLDVGPFTGAVIGDLSGGVTYYFAVTAYDTSGNESVTSREVQATIPVASKSICTLTITKKGAGAGTVASSPAGTMFSAGTAVTLTATPDSNSTFAGWSGGYVGSATSCIVAMTKDVGVTATFNLKTYTIRSSAGRGGSISPSGSISVNAGTYKTFVFTPSTGYCISSVKIDGISISPIASYTFNTVKANHSISVSFRRKTR